MKPILCLLALLLSPALHAQPGESSPSRPGDRQQDKPHAVMGELGWNGLGGGLGVHYSHYFPAKASVADLAVGWGVTGSRVGARYRHLLAPHRRTSPFLGAGLNYATGQGETEVDITGNRYDTDTLMVLVNPSANFLLNVGVDLKADNGFVFVPSIGWGFDLMGDDYEVASGTATARRRQVLRLMLKGGFQLSFIAGRSF